MDTVDSFRITRLPLPLVRGEAQDPAGAEAAHDRRHLARRGRVIPQPGHRLGPPAAARPGSGVDGAAAFAGGVVEDPGPLGVWARPCRVRRRARGALLLLPPAATRARPLRPHTQGPPPVHGARGVCVAVRASGGARDRQCAAHCPAASPAGHARPNHVGVSGVAAGRDGDGTQRVRLL